MLLRIRDGTPKSAVYKALNDELLHFLAECRSGLFFRKELFSGRCRKAIWGNAPTRNAFKRLWMVLSQLSAADRNKVIEDIISAQNLSEYFGNKTKAPIKLPSQVHNLLKALTHHLFTRTSELVAIEQASAESVIEHYTEFSDVNGLICCACGLEAITVLRSDIKEDEQWRGPYDHYLPAGKYPAYGVHPANLIPICQTCNSKAKLAKDPICEPKTGARRSAFDPLVECAHKHVSVEVSEAAKSVNGRLPTPKFTVEFLKSYRLNDEKIETWDSVYNIKQRVEAHFSDIIIAINVDCTPDSAESLQAAIAKKAKVFGQNHRKHSGGSANFWKHKLYSWLNKKEPEFIHVLWCCIEAKSDEFNNNRVFNR